MVKTHISILAGTVLAVIGKSQQLQISGQQCKAARDQPWCFQIAVLFPPHLDASPLTCLLYQWIVE